MKSSGKTIAIATYEVASPTPRTLSPQSRQLRSDDTPREQPPVVRQVTQASVATFETSMIEIADALQTSFTEIESRSSGGMRLDSVEVQLEVSAEGKVAILGSGGSLSGKTSLKLTFKRPS